MQFIRKSGVERLAPAEHRESRRAPPAGREQVAPAGGRRLQDGDGGGVEQVHQQARVRALLARRDHRRRAHGQRQQEFEHRDVEREGGDREQAVGGREAGRARHALEEVDDGALRDPHALRRPVEPEV